jgi:transketolase
MSQVLEAGTTISMRDVFGETILKFTQDNKDVVVLDGDLANSTKIDTVAKGNPQQFFQMGIAEQNMAGVAAGLATVGLKPWVVTFAAFLSKRALDQIAISIAQPKLNVKLIGAYSGLLNGCTGKTHQGLEDIAIMRSLPNMVVLSPADAVELKKAMIFASQYDGPVYVRVARDPQTQVFSEATHQFELGKGVIVKYGNDLTIISTGTQTERALQAAKILEEKEGILATVLHLSSIKPIDEVAIIEAAKRTGAIVTAEEHSIVGGLGGAVAEVLAEHHPTPIIRVGVKDRNSESGASEALLKKYEISTLDIAKQAKEILKRKA